jgi:hypothetical protein
MPAQFTLPPDTRAVGTGNPPADMNAVVDALTAQGTASNILNAAYAGGADPTGTADSTAAFNDAVAALPTITLHDSGTSGTALAVPQGTIIIPAGTFKFGSSGTDPVNVGPCVNVIYVPLTGASVTITNAELHVNSAGSGLTSSQNFAGVYDNTGTRIGVTADQSTPWASAGLKQMALTGGPFTGTWPWVTVAFVSNGTTPPSFAAGGFIALANAHATGAGLIFATNGSGATAMPASLTYSSNSVTNAHTYWAGVS